MADLHKAGTCVLVGLGQTTSADGDIPAQLELYRQGRLKLDELITTRYTLDDIATGFDDMHAGRNLRGVVVFWPSARHDEFRRNAWVS